MIPVTEQFIKRYRDRPDLFVREIIRAKPKPYQVKWMLMVAANLHCAIRASRGPGKTTVAAWLVLWFFVTRFMAQVVITAPTFDRHIKDRFWPELRKWIRRSSFLSELIQVEKYHLRIKHDDYRDEWFVVGTSSNEPGNMEGFHAPHLMFVVDEAKTVAREIFEAITGSLTDNVGEQRMLLISTPAEVPRGYFYDCFTKWRNEWATASISAFEAIEQGARISWKWIVGKANSLNGGVIDRKTGSPAWQAQVLGQFPDHGEMVLIPITWLERAVYRHPAYQLDRQGELPLVATQPVEAGLDVSEGGGDKTVLAIRQGDVLWALHQLPADRTQATYGAVKRALVEWNSAAKVGQRDKVGPVERLKVERTGPGRGVGDLLHADGELPPMTWYVPAARARDRETFHNLRAEIWWQLRRRFEEGDIAIPDDDELLADLASIGYGYSDRGRLKIDLKEDIRDELGRSPDKGDACMIAFAKIAGISGLTGKLSV